jgi:signal transduction histidine kinase
MKNLTAVLMSITAFIMLFAVSCTENCDCPTPTEGMVTQGDLDKMIVRVNTTNVSTGLESVFKEMVTDSTDRAHMCQVFVDAARFYEDGSGYFFIETLHDAWVVAHINHDIIGTSRIDVKDEYGNYFIREMVEAVSYSGSGFVEYYRKNPTTEAIELKLSFVTSIPSANWFIGTGFYGDPPEVYYDYTDAQQKILLETVNTLSKGIGAIIEQVYSTEEEDIAFCRAFIDHIRFFDNRSGYFFISDLDGVTLAHGANKELEGLNQIDLQDTKGAYIIQDMIDIVETEGSGFYTYFWNNPATGSEDQKTTFVTRIPNTDYMICAGYYMD